MSGETSNNAPKTIITLGVARGGTSLVAGTLHHLGIFSGDASHSPVFEDCRLSDAFEKRSSELPKDVIFDYNRRHDIWAFKRPASTTYLRKLTKLARNPHYVLIFKDLLAIANRNAISMGFNVNDGLQSALKSYTTLVKFIQTSNAPKLLVSYEKAVEDEGGFVDELCSFLQLEVSVAQRRAAVEFIQPDSAEYLDKTRANRIVGCIESVSANSVRGWSSYAHSKTSHSVALQLLVNGHTVQHKKACQARFEVAPHRSRSFSDAGFTFTLGEHSSLIDNDEIRVVASETGCDIEKSPWTYRSS